MSNSYCADCKTNFNEVLNMCPKCFASKASSTSSKKKNKYSRQIKQDVWVDVYDVIAAFEVTDGAMQHALKKILACGKRGHKNVEEDRSDILKSIQRSNEIYQERKNYE